MAFATRAAGPLSTIVFIAVLSLSATTGADGRERGIPKSAPAFTKYVAGSIREAMPTARITIIGRLRLDVEAPNGGHTTDLHNIYSICQRNRDTCGEDVASWIGQMTELYKETDAPPTRDALRVIIRPSAYVAAVRANPKRNRPLAAPLVGDYWMMIAADRPTAIMILDENDLGAMKLTKNEAVTLAFANMRRVLRPMLQHELAKGPYDAMMTGDPYMSSTLLFVDIWATAAHACKDNLLVAVPAADVVLYDDGTKPGALQSIIHAADDVVAHAEKPFSDSVFRWSASGWKLVQVAARK